MKLRDFKKRYFLGKDDFGNNLYPGDLVELWVPIETRHPYTTEIHWNMIDGAFVDGHPAHVLLGHNESRRLSSFIDRKPISYHREYEDGSTKLVTEKGYCKKVKSVWNRYKKIKT